MAERNVAISGGRDTNESFGGRGEGGGGAGVDAFHAKERITRAKK